MALDLDFTREGIMSTHQEGMRLITYIIGFAEEQEVIPNWPEKSLRPSQRGNCHGLYLVGGSSEQEPCSQDVAL